MILITINFISNRSWWTSRQKRTKTWQKKSTQRFDLNFRWRSKPNAWQNSRWLAILPTASTLQKARPWIHVVKRSSLSQSCLQNWLVAGTKAAKGNDCITPDGKAGTCAYVTDPICAPIYDVIQQRGNVKGEFLRYLQTAARFQFHFLQTLFFEKARLCFFINKK